MPENPLPENPPDPLEPIAPAAPPFARPIVAPVPPAVRAEPFLLMHRSRFSVLKELAAVGAILLMLVACTAIWVFVAQTWRLVPPPETEPGRMVNLAVTLGMGIMAVACVVFTLRITGDGPASVGFTFRRSPGANLLLGVLAAPAAYVAVLIATIILCATSQAAQELLQSNPEQVRDVLPKLHPLGFLALSAGVGLWEELVFRGYLMTRLRRVTGSWWIAVPLVSAVFAALHIGAQVALFVIPLFLMAVVWSLFTVWRRSVIPAVVGHALFDFVSFLAIYY